MPLPPPKTKAINMESVLIAKGITMDNGLSGVFIYRKCIFINVAIQ